MVYCLCKLTVCRTNLTISIYQLIDMLIGRVQIVEVALLTLLRQFVGQLSLVTLRLYVKIDGLWIEALFCSINQIVIEVGQLSTERQCLRQALRFPLIKVERERNRLTWHYVTAKTTATH